MDDTAAADAETLPPLYQKWAASLLSAPIPRERVATCADCAMCVPKEEQHAGVGYFQRSLKCCTYFPKLPNYLVGRALDGDNPGAERLRAFIAGEAGEAKANLLGVFPGTHYSVIYSATSTDGFGKDPGLLCPYAIEAEGPEGPRCGIWQHRNAVCTSYFCKHVRGQTGHIFWQSFRNLLIDMESALAWWAVAELIPEAGKLLGSLPVSDPHTFDLPAGVCSWRYWRGTRDAFYMATAELVEALRWEEAIAIAGIKTNMRAREVQARFDAATSSEVPARVRTATYQVVAPGERATVIQTPGSIETFQVPSSLLPLLAYFDGRETETVLADIKERTGVSVAPGLVRRLCDFRVLQPVGDEGGA